MNFEFIVTLTKCSNYKLDTFIFRFTDLRDIYKHFNYFSLLNIRYVVLYCLETVYYYNLLTAKTIELVFDINV